MAERNITYENIRKKYRVQFPSLDRHVLAQSVEALQKKPGSAYFEIGETINSAEQTDTKRYILVRSRNDYTKPTPLATGFFAPLINFLIRLFKPLTKVSTYRYYLIDKEREVFKFSDDSRLYQTWQFNPDTHIYVEEFFCAQLLDASEMVNQAVMNQYKNNECFYIRTTEPPIIYGNNNILISYVDNNYDALKTMGEKTLLKRIRAAEAVIDEAKRLHKLNLMHGALDEDRILIKENDDGRYEAKFVDFYHSEAFENSDETRSPENNALAQTFIACLTKEDPDNLPDGFQVLARRCEDEQARCTDSTLSLRGEQQQRQNLKSEGYIYEKWFKKYLGFIDENFSLNNVSNFIKEMEECILIEDKNSNLCQEKEAWLALAATGLENYKYDEYTALNYGIAEESKESFYAAIIFLDSFDILNKENLIILLHAYHEDKKYYDELLMRISIFSQYNFLQHTDPQMKREVHEELAKTLSLYLAVTPTFQRWLDSFLIYYQALPVEENNAKLLLDFLQILKKCLTAKKSSIIRHESKAKLALMTARLIGFQIDDVENFFDSIQEEDKKNFYKIIKILDKHGSLNDQTLSLLLNYYKNNREKYLHLVTLIKSLNSLSPFSDPCYKFQQCCPKLEMEIAKFSSDKDHTKYNDISILITVREFKDKKAVITERKRANLNKLFVLPHDDLLKAAAIFKKYEFFDNEDDFYILLNLDDDNEFQIDLINFIVKLDEIDEVLKSKADLKSALDCYFVIAKMNFALEITSYSQVVKFDMRKYFSLFDADNDNVKLKNLYEKLFEIHCLIKENKFDLYRQKHFAILELIVAGVWSDQIKNNFSEYDNIPPEQCEYDEAIKFYATIVLFSHKEILTEPLFNKYYDFYMRNMGRYAPYYAAICLLIDCPNNVSSVEALFNTNTTILKIISLQYQYNHLSHGLLKILFKPQDDESSKRIRQAVEYLEKNAYLISFINFLAKMDKLNILSLSTLEDVIQFYCTLAEQAYHYGNEIDQGICIKKYLDLIESTSDNEEVLKNLYNKLHEIYTRIENDSDYKIGASDIVEFELIAAVLVESALSEAAIKVITLLSKFGVLSSEYKEFIFKYQKEKRWIKISDALSYLEEKNLITKENISKVFKKLMDDYLKHNNFAISILRYKSSKKIDIELTGEKLDELLEGIFLDKTKLPFTRVGEVEIGKSPIMIKSSEPSSFALLKQGFGLKATKKNESFSDIAIQEEPSANVDKHKHPLQTKPERQKLTFLKFGQDLSSTVGSLFKKRKNKIDDVVVVMEELPPSDTCDEKNKDTSDKSECQSLVNFNDSNQEASFSLNGS